MAPATAFDKAAQEAGCSLLFTMEDGVEVMGPALMELCSTTVVPMKNCRASMSFQQQLCRCTHDARMMRMIEAEVELYRVIGPWLELYM